MFNNCDIIVELVKDTTKWQRIGLCFEKKIPQFEGKKKSNCHLEISSVFIRGF